jgi:hypothetical protein
MDNVQNCDSYITTPWWQTCRSYWQTLTAKSTQLILPASAYGSFNIIMSRIVLIIAFFFLKNAGTRILFLTLLLTLIYCI